MLPLLLQTVVLRVAPGGMPTASLKIMQMVAAVKEIRERKIISSSFQRA